ncbi:cytochrome P450 [Zychaea mexicana]|uniref:cytochrome P450 n=1 Tax=Zychaea mexicana TaxID=64656 RepID=UPI0022FE8016|nr:cytochrome P450 [Zychaea mexicana]KAI9491660.1 cytochrome P450 [Zychaea mexicana]
MNTDTLSSWQALGLACAAAASALSAKYNDRAIFDEHRANIPYKKGYPLLGGLPFLLGNVLSGHDFTTQTFEELDTLTWTMSSLGIKRNISTIDPANIEHILKDNLQDYIKGPKLQEAFSDLVGEHIFNDHSKKWRYQRKAANIIFNAMNIRDHFTAVFVHDLRYMIKEILNVAAVNREPVDFQDLMYKFTLDSFVQLGFGVAVNGLQQKGKANFAESFDVLQSNGSWRLVFPIWKLSEAIKPILFPWQTSIKDHVKAINSYAYEFIAKRKKEMAEGQEPEGFLSRLMNVRDEAGEPSDERSLRDAILAFFVAGRDTTAGGLSWTFYNLMLHPRIENKLFEEIKSHVTDEIESDPVALYEAIKKMNYAHAVFYEVLRLYPPLPANIRYALKDDILPDGTHVRSGDYIVWSLYALGRSTKVWGPDAKDFRPERWLTPEGEVRRESQAKWPAFHAGPRSCPGQKLSTLESLVVVVMLLKRYKFSLVPDQEVTYTLSATLVMHSGMKVFVEQR